MGLLDSVFGGGGAGKGLGVGDRVPDFELADQNGKPVSMGRFRGRTNIVLYFYPKDDTSGCTRESCSFRDHYEEFKDAGAEVVGVSSDSPGSHEKFASKYSLPFTLLSDPGGRVRKAFGVPATLGLIPGRVTYVIDKQGVIRHVFNSQFNPNAHVDEALRVLATLS
jgi:thioredoxin-dependent peroxiredoxin